MPDFYYQPLLFIQQGFFYAFLPETIFMQRLTLRVRLRVPVVARFLLSRDVVYSASLFLCPFVTNYCKVMDIPSGEVTPIDIGGFIITYCVAVVLTLFNMQLLIIAWMKYFFICNKCD